MPLLHPLLPRGQVDTLDFNKLGPGFAVYRCQRLHPLPTSGVPLGGLHLTAGNQCSASQYSLPHLLKHVSHRWIEGHLLR